MMKTSTRPLLLRIRPFRRVRMGRAIGRNRYTRSTSYLIAALIVAACFSWPHRAPAVESKQSASLARTLYGISVGEDAKEALSRLGLQPPRWGSATATAAGAKPLAEYRVFLADGSRALIGLVFDTKIRVIIVHPNASHSSRITDPFGIRLNDSVERLKKKRGRPDSITTQGEYVYGPMHGLHWFYSIHGGRIAAIGVSDEPRNS